MQRHWKREIRAKLTKRDVGDIIARWDGKESTREYAIDQLTEWRSIKTIR